ncbi:MAG: hypothetical protein LBK61_07710 [Spirochaetaceae bacterium]|nr:hypothetical protein [Spirochaetaceae bacterium]
MNDAIIPAKFMEIRAEGGELPNEGGRMVIGAGETVLNITLENIRSTRYGLEISGDEGFVKAAPESDVLSDIRLTLECPKEKEGEEKDLDITLHLVPPPGRAQPEDYLLRLKYALGQIQFLHIIPNAPGPVTKLVLVFAGSVPDLSTDDISVMVDDGDRFHPKSLDNPSDGIYEIGIEEITLAKKITVEIARAGYGRVSKSVDVDVNADNTPGAIEFLHAVAHDSGGTTEKIALVFDRDIGIGADDITVTGSDTVTKGELTQKVTGAGVYELAVTGVTRTETINIQATKSGYAIVPDSLTVDVRYVAPARNVTVSDEIEHGILVPFPAEAAMGQTVTVYLYPAENCAYRDDSLGLVGADNVAFVSQSDRIFTFTMPDEDVELTAQFFEAAAKLAVGGAVRYYEKLEEAFAKVDTGSATITVLNDVTLSGEIAVKGTVTLVAADGKAKRVKRGSSFQGSLFTVGTDASLTLGAGDSLGLALDGDGGNITATAPLVAVSGGTLAMGNGVALRNNMRQSNDNNDACGILVNNSGTFTMAGGEISGNKMSSHWGGGVLVDGSSTFTMSGGTVSDNEAGSGGGVVVRGGSTFEMTGGAISNNKAIDGVGGGVSVGGSNSQFTMKGGAISGNTAVTNGSGVYVGDGTFTMSGNAVVQQDNDVYLPNGSTVTVAAALTPGQNNAAGGPAFSAKITPETTGDGTVIITGASNSILQNAVGKFTLNTGTSKMALSLDGTSAKLSTARSSVNIGNETVYFASLSDAVSGIGTGATTSATPAVIMLMNDIEIGTAVTVSSKHIKIKPDRDGVTVKRGMATGSLFTVGSNASLTLEGNGSASLVIDGGSGNSLTATAALVSVNSGGTLTMNNGAAVQNNNNTADSFSSGGVYIASGGTFNMNGGEISGNTKGGSNSYNSGGGVFVNGSSSSQGVFNLYGGTIKNNTARVGGGVHVYSYGVFTMYAGEITENEAVAGGGVSLSRGGSAGNCRFVLKNGKITGNKAINYNTTSNYLGSGGGVYVSSSSGLFFEMSGGLIGNNEAYTYSTATRDSTAITGGNGGGVYFVNTEAHIISGGTISGNKAGGSGGGLCLNDASLNMTGGTIYGTDAPDNSLQNTAGSTGSGAALYKSGDPRENTITSYP